MTTISTQSLREQVYRGAQNNKLVASVIPGGQPVLFLHGGGQTRHSWSETQERVAARGYAAITVDQRGHGESDWIADGAYSFLDFAEDARLIARAIKAATAAAPVAVGASLGGIAALLALGQEAKVFAALILVDVVPHMERSGIDSIQRFMRARAEEGFASVDEAAEAVAEYLPHRPKPASLEGLRKNLRRHEDGRWRWHWDPRFLDGPRPVEADFENVMAKKIAAAKALVVPTLLVRGRASELVSEASVAKFRELAPQAHYVDIADARHMVAGDRNDVFGDTVLRFLEEHFPIQ